MAVGIKNVHIAVAKSRAVSITARILFCVSDDERAADGLNVERYETGRKGTVLESALPVDGAKTLVEHVNCAGAEIGGVQEGALRIRGNCQARVNGANARRLRPVDGGESIGHINAGAPARNGPLFGGEQENAGARKSVFCHDKAISAIEYRACRARRTPSQSWHANDKWHTLAVTGVEG